MEEVNVPKKRARDSPPPEDPDSDTDSPVVKRLRESLLDSLDDDPEFCTLNQDLDSFMKSFEEEINAGVGAAEVDISSDSGDSRPDLGYLLEASDDELGIPPPTSSPGGLEDELRTELVRAESDSSEFAGSIWENPSCDSFGEMDSYSGEYGLFDYSDLGLGSTDFMWRPESMPAQ